MLAVVALEESSKTILPCMGQGERILREVEPLLDGSAASLPIMWVGITVAGEIPAGRERTRPFTRQTVGLFRLAHCLEAVVSDLVLTGFHALSRLYPPRL